MKLDTVTWIVLGLSLTLTVVNQLRCRSLKRAISARLRTSGLDAESIAAPPDENPLLRDLWTRRDEFATSLTDSLDDPELRSLVEDYRRHARTQMVAHWIVSALFALAILLRFLD